MKFKRAGLAALAVTAIAASSLIGPQQASFAGTGGLNGSGIIYGEGSNYCEVANLGIVKVDSETGRPLADATFTIQAADGVGIKAGVYNQGTKTAPNGNVDRDAWQHAFNMSADQAFTATPFGTLYRAAGIITAADEEAAERIESNGEEGDGGLGMIAEGTQVDIDGDGVMETYTDTDGDGIVDSAVNADGTVVAVASTTGTTFVPVRQIVYPADITGVTNPSAQSSQMQLWSGWETVADDPATEDVNEARSSVNDFSVATKERLDAIGAVLFANYDAASPAAPATAPSGPITGALPETIAHVQAEYTKAYNVYQAIQEAVEASGYPNAVFAADGSLTRGAFGGSGSQDWAAFVDAYNRATDNAAQTFGIRPADFELVKSVIGEAGVDAANNAGNDAVGATYMGDGAGDGLITLTTDADGRVEYSVFGRSATRGGDCAGLTAVANETAAPNGYILDDQDREMVPSNVNMGVGVVQYLTVDNEPEIPTKPGPDPESPEFESGK